MHLQNWWKHYRTESIAIICVSIFGLLALFALQGFFQSSLLFLPTTITAEPGLYQGTMVRTSQTGAQMEAEVGIVLEAEPYVLATASGSVLRVDMLVVNNTGSTLYNDVAALLTFQDQILQMPTAEHVRVFDQHLSVDTEITGQIDAFSQDQFVLALRGSGFLPRGRVHVASVDFLLQPNLQSLQGIRMDVERFHLINTDVAYNYASLSKSKLDAGMTSQPLLMNLQDTIIREVWEQEYEGDVSQRHIQTYYDASGARTEQRITEYGLHGRRQLQIRDLYSANGSTIQSFTTTFTSLGTARVSEEQKNFAEDGTLMSTTTSTFDPVTGVLLSQRRHEGDLSTMRTFGMFDALMREERTIAGSGDARVEVDRYAVDNEGKRVMYRDVMYANGTKSMWKYGLTDQGELVSEELLANRIASTAGQRISQPGNPCSLEVLPGEDPLHVLSMKGEDANIMVQPVRGSIVAAPVTVSSQHTTLFTRGVILACKVSNLPQEVALTFARWDGYGDWIPVQSDEVDGTLRSVIERAGTYAIMTQ